MDVEKTIEFLLAHQARMAAENELFHAHQAEVRADHEERFKELHISQLEFSQQFETRLSALAKLVADGYEYLDRADKSQREESARLKENDIRSKENEARYKQEQQELHRHMDERLNALIQIVDEMIRKRPQQ